MENASKALIIAGSILLSILIIALGMYIFSTSSSTSNVEILNETEIQTYNSKFEKYKDSQLGSNIDALINALRSNYTTNNGSKEKIPTVLAVDIDGFNSATQQIDYDHKSNYVTNLQALAEEIQKSHRYEVKMTYDDNGLINQITIDYKK